MQKAANILSERYKKDAFLLLSIHDELLFEVRKEKAEAVGKELTEAMEHVYSLSVPLTVEMKRGENWGTMRAI
jgi:DNA polymerase-1